jgi:hypothetical protein
MANVTPSAARPDATPSSPALRRGGGGGGGI